MMQITHGETQWARLCGALGLDADTARYEDVLVTRYARECADRLPRVYVAGPYTHGDVAQNVRNAILCADWLAERECVPFTPHLSHFAHMLAPRPYEHWITQDLAWLRVCDALVRLPGESQGAEIEVVQAQALGLPVFMWPDSALSPSMVANDAWRLMKDFAAWREGWGK